MHAALRSASSAPADVAPGGGDARIPIHGGPGTEGIFNTIYPTYLQPSLGFTSIAAGSSWIMTVEFTDDGTRSEGVLSYSQSTTPSSPHDADQTLLYSREGWDDLRFTRAAVVEGTVKRSVVREGPADCRRGGWQAFASPDFTSQAECLAWFRGGP